jgi:hypothetical protein
MRILRFLQAHPYWLCKSSLLLIFIALAFLLFNVLTGQNDTILYPLVVSLPLVSLLILGVALLALIIEPVINLTRIRRISFWGYVSFAILTLISGLAAIAVIGPKINPIYPVDSVVYDGQIYILTGGEGLVGLNTIVKHTLYECDQFGIICKLISQVDLVEGWS